MTTQACLLPLNHFKDQLQSTDRRADDENYVRVRRLNRPTSKTYSGATTEGTNAANATAPVYFKYDTQSLPSGAPSGFDCGKAVG
jgi:hypothetical protein